MQRREQAQHSRPDRIAFVRSACAAIYKAQGRRRYKHRDRRERCAVPNTEGAQKQGAMTTRGQRTQTPLCANATLYNETMDANANTNKSRGTRNDGAHATRRGSAAEDEVFGQDPKLL